MVVTGDITQIDLPSDQRSGLIAVSEVHADRQPAAAVRRALLGRRDRIGRDVAGDLGGGCRRCRRRRDESGSQGRDGTGCPGSGDTQSRQRGSLLE